MINHKTHLMVSLVEHKRSNPSSLRRTTATLTLTQPVGITRADGEPDVLSRRGASRDGGSVRHVDEGCGMWVRPVED